jgi:hypothetical protein
VWCGFGAISAVKIEIYKCFGGVFRDTDFFYSRYRFPKSPGFGGDFRSAILGELSHSHVRVVICTARLPVTVIIDECDKCLNRLFASPVKLDPF